MALVINRNLTKDRAVSTAEMASIKYVAEIRDTSELQSKIDLSRYVDVEQVNPTSLVVVDQFPKAGEKVPLGTPVTLTFMSKDSIRVADVAELSDGIQVTYANDSIKKITDDIQTNAEVTMVLAENKEYIEMNATQKDAVKKYAVEKGIIESSASEEIVAEVHKDLTFIYNI